MEKQLRYQGEFFSVAGVLWRVEIWQDADVPYPAVAELRRSIAAASKARQK